MYHRVKIGLGLLFFICIGMNPESALAQMKKGEKFFNEGKYAEAVRPLKKEFEGKNQNQDAGILLAKCYYQLLDYQEALDVISIVGTANLPNFDDRRFYADVLIANDDFSGAYLILIQLLSEDESDPKSYLWLDKVGELMAWDSIESSSSIGEISGMNSVYNEYAPYYNDSGELWFVNDITNIQSVFPSSYNNQNMHLYYKTSFRAAGSNRVNKPSMLIKNKDYYFHDGPLDEWSEQGKFALTLRDLDGPIGGGVLGIYFSEMTGAEEDVISFKHNGDYNTGHPTFDRNGTRMIFASDRPGGYGQMDLWYSDWEEGTWTEPRNMGPVINTPFNEVFPNHAYNRLFFSSDRQDKGYGGLDLYYSSKSLNYDEVYNLRAPVNGPYDDFGTTFSSSQGGYLASNRRGGSGGDDIYIFTFQPEQTPISKCKFRIIEGDVAEDSEVQLYNGDGDLVMTTKVGPDGKVVFDDLKSRESYTMKVGGAGVAQAALLASLSGDGDILSTFPQSEDNTFKFELLPSTDYGIKKKDMIDDSQLVFEINGKIIADDSVNLKGVPVSLLGPTGAILATVETTEEGEFTIEGAQMGEDYTLETEGLDEYHEIDVFGTTGAITQSLTPMGNNQFAYTRAVPAAMWMIAADVVVPAVFAVILDNEPTQNESVILFDEQDSILSRPHVDEDGFLGLGSLVTGKAYRLNMPQRSLGRDNRLVVLDGNGDTSQTVRPFDANNYFFEYLLYSDYGAFEEEAPMVAGTATGIVVAEPAKASVLKMRVANFRPEAPVAFVLMSQDGNTASDTMYINSSGVAIIRGLDPTTNYQVALVDTTFGEAKSLEIYDGANQKVYAGMTSPNSTAELILAPVVPALAGTGEYEIRISDFDADEPVDFALLSDGESVVNDAMYSNSTRIATLQGLDPNESYQLALIDTVFGSNKAFEVYDDSNQLVYSGVTGVSEKAEFQLVELMLPVSEFRDYEIRIADFDSSNPIAMVLKTADGTVVNDDLKIISGAAELKGLNPEMNYELALVDTLFGKEQALELREQSYFLMYSGTTGSQKTANFKLSDLPATSGEMNGYQLRVADFKVDEPLSFMLKTKDGTLVNSAVDFNSDGVADIGGLNPNMAYEITLNDTVFGSEKTIEVYVESSQLVYSGMTSPSNSLVIPLHEIEEATAEKREYEIRISKFKSDEPVAFVLKSEDGEVVVSDVLHPNSTRMASMKGLDPGTKYELALKDTVFGSPKSVEIYNESNQLIYSGMTGTSQTAEFKLPGEKPVKVETEEFELHITEFNVAEPTAFVLKSTDGSVVTDTMYIQPNGKVKMQGIDPTLSYEIALVDTVFGAKKRVEIYNSSDELVYTGETGEYATASIDFLKDDDYDLNKLNNGDESLLSMGLSGKVYNTSDTLVKMEVLDSENNKLAETYIGKDQKFVFKDLKPDEQYILNLENSPPETFLKVYVANNQDSLTIQRNSDNKFYVNFEGEAVTLVDNNQEEVTVNAGTKFELENIYYDFNSFVPKTTSQPSMDMLATVMKNNPTLHIEIQSHTDSRGPANYNALLSQKRAAGVVDYLVSKGIAKNRMKAVGMGEKQLTNKCADGIRCPNSEHAKNRRTEFVILGNDQ